MNPYTNEVFEFHLKPFRSTFIKAVNVSDWTRAGRIQFWGCAPKYTSFPKSTRATLPPHRELRTWEQQRGSPAILQSIRHHLQHPLFYLLLLLSVSLPSRTEAPQGWDFAQYLKNYCLARGRHSSSKYWTTESTLLPLMAQLCPGSKILFLIYTAN